MYLFRSKDIKQEQQHVKFQTFVKYSNLQKENL